MLGNTALDDDSGNKIAVRTTSITDDSWHHVAFTYDGSSNRTGLKAYVDRQDVGILYDGQTGSISGTIKNDHPIGIGSSSTGQGTTNGTRLDDLRIYDIELNSTQVTKIYNKGLLSKQIASANQQIADLQAENTDLQNQITSVNGTVIALNAQVSVIDTLIDYINTFLNGTFLNYEP